MTDSSDTDPFANRLRDTFQAEADALLDERKVVDSNDGSQVPSVTVEQERAETPTPPWWKRSLMPLAAALVLVVGVGAVLALSNRPVESPAEVADAAASHANADPTAAYDATSTPLAQQASPTAIPTPDISTMPGPDVVPAGETPEDAPPPTFCVVNIVAPDTLNVRRGPGVDTEIVWELEPNQCGIESTGPAVDGWIPIRVALSGDVAETVGWVSGNFVSPKPRPTVLPSVSVPPEPVIPPFQPGIFQDSLCVTGIVAPDVLNLRTGPGIDNPIVEPLPSNQCRIYAIGEPVDGWLPVVVSGGDGGDLDGWVSGRYLAVPEPDIDLTWPTTIITVELDYLFDPADTMPAITAFQITTPEGDVIANLDDNAMFAFPSNLDPGTLWIRAEFPGDPYCGWTGALRYGGPGNVYTAELAALCA